MKLNFKMSICIELPIESFEIEETQDELRAWDIAGLKAITNFKLKYPELMPYITDEGCSDFKKVG